MTQSKTTPGYSCCSTQSAFIPTHTIDVRLPANTKYLSRNPVSRLLIRGFMRALVDLAIQTDACTILDVGCGEGLVIRQLDLLWSKEAIHGVDISPELLKVAQNIASNAVYFAGNVYQLPLPDHYYDLVICTELLEHLNNPQAALAEITRVGKDHCLLSVPHEPWWRIANVMRGSYLTKCGNTPGHINHWSRQGFTKFVSSYVNVVDVRQPFPWIMVLGRVRTGLQQ